MNTFEAFSRNIAAQGSKERVFDWEKAARLIKESGAKEASAGLAGDWEWTCGQILEDGKPIPRERTYTFLSSTWAIPELEINGARRDCFRLMSETPGWGSDTYWPPEALAILNAEEANQPTDATPSP